MSNENILNIQREIVAGERAKQIAQEQRLKKDIRGQIARNGFYNPDNDPVYQYVPFPRWVEVWDEGKKKEVLVHSEDEEAKVLGKQREPAKVATVDTNELEKIVTVVPKRGRPKKQAIEPLPPTIE